MNLIFYNIVPMQLKYKIILTLKYCVMPNILYIKMADWLFSSNTLSNIPFS